MQDEQAIYWVEKPSVFTISDSSCLLKTLYAPSKTDTTVREVFHIKF